MAVLLLLLVGIFPELLVCTARAWMYRMCFKHSTANKLKKKVQSASQYAKKKTQSASITVLPHIYYEYTEYNRVGPMEEQMT